MFGQVRECLSEHLYRISSMAGDIYIRNWQHLSRMEGMKSPINYGGFRKGKKPYLEPHNNYIDQPTEKNEMKNTYNFIYAQPNVAEQEIELTSYGFVFSFETEYFPNGGNGRATVMFNHVDEKIWDVPEINISFDDSSEDYSGLLETMREILMWCEEHKEYIKVQKEHFYTTL